MYPLYALNGHVELPNPGRLVMMSEAGAAAVKVNIESMLRDEESAARRRRGERDAMAAISKSRATESC